MQPLLLFIILLQVADCWHDLSNVQFHCWPFGANDDNPTAFAVCVGVDLDWIKTPPLEVLESEPFQASFSLVLTPDFYTWAVQDAQDNFKSNFFKKVDGTFMTSNATVAQEWCEQTECPDKCSEATQDNCCMHHVNVHSCPVDEVQFGLCPPWIPADGEFYTHSEVNCGSARQTNWTAEFSGLHLKGNKVTSTALIAHFKIATMHVALNWRLTVLPRSACGDQICDADEDCETCPNDCSRCPLTPAEISGIAVFVFVVLLVVLGAFGYVRYTNNKLLWDESWIINYLDIKPAATSNEQTAVGAVSFINLRDPVMVPTVQEHILAEANKPELGQYKGEIYVLKRLNKKNFKLTKQIRTEVRQIRRFDHMNLASFVGACVKPPNLMILSKFCPKGNLANVLKAKNVPLSWAFRSSFATDIISGLCYLHSHLVEHGRLKIENCLVDDRWSIKLADFGVPSLRSQDARGDSVYRGLELWKAPELKPGEMSVGGDVFAYGIILIQISTRCDLPMDKEDTLAKVKMDWKNLLTRNGLDDTDKCPCPGSLATLVEICLTEKDALRPSAPVVKRQLKTLNPTKMNAVDMMMLMMEKYSKHLELLVAEKTQDLLAEKQRTDELLHAMLPKQVADDLRMGRPVNANQFDSCTVYFSDIVGFTTISGRMSAMDVVVFLNKLYSCFDTVIDKHDVYKVETIGDAYMVVSGVPIRNGDKHVCHIADMALDLLKESKNFIIPNMPNEPLKIRIGLHTGPVCAGVVGLKMPRYCLFGDTVNTASRMESTGEAYRIHMSNDTRNCLVKQSGGNEYKIEERGTITVKGKGELKTWWLQGKVTQANKLSTTMSSILNIDPPGLVSVGQ